MPSTRKLADELNASGHPASAAKVADLLGGRGSVCRPTPKTTESRQHADRDAQFSCLHSQAADHHNSGDPVIGVDTKRKELLGDSRTAAANGDRSLA
ncbi:MAG: hypothetical protein QM621_07575 [Aeromicrobium sp.]|uniref:ISAzo13-like element transposase-related protein n=1 Tax=Aeromicrobium sp. TaxID=1871063 RepID=UPI0039E5DB17